MVSGVVGAASLSYSQMYVPYVTPVTVPFTVSFGAPTMNADGASLHLPAHVELRNSSSVRIYVLGTLWTVTGNPATFDPQGKGMDEWKRDMLEHGSTLTHVRYSPSRLLGAGEFVTPGSPIDPGDAESSDTNVDVPLRSGLGRVTISATISYIRADRVRLPVNHYMRTIEASWDTESQQQKHQWDAPKWVAESGDEVYRHYSTISHSSEMANLTHASDYVTVWWTIPKWHEGRPFAKDDTLPYLSASVTRVPDGEEHISGQEAESYGVAIQRVDTERPIEELLKAARK
ncbi:hypothetical protein AB0E62_31830 [Streptomyces sp. NPDC038707]|uniref:hypothetical protein n=1 Tax=Streptomyces sp. NPDC038707 TaxID=3154329 RepID=UPI0033C9AEE3